MTSTRKRALALALFVVACTGLWVHPYRAQQASRYALTAAITEERTIVLDSYVDVIGIDRSIRDGRVYSDKAPGQPFMAVPFYAVYRAVGGDDAKTLRVDGNVGLWWQTLWFSSIPLALLAVLMLRDAERTDRATAGTLSIVFGTLLLPFGALLFGHVLSTLFVYAAWILIRKEGDGVRGLIFAGSLIGLAVVTEYTTAIAGLVLLAVAVLRHRRGAGWIVVGGLPFAVALAAYNQAAFGNPTTLSYSFSAFDEVTDVARPVSGFFSELRLEHMSDLFLSSRGFMVASPIVVIALVSAVSVALGRHAGLPRIDGAVPLLMFGLYLLIPLFWGNPWGGDSPGPRYMITALPFLVVPAAVAWQRYRIPTALVTALSVITMTAATVTDPMLARDGNWGLNVWGRWVAQGEFVPNILEIGLGLPAWSVAIPILVSGVVLAAWVASRFGPQGIPGRSA